MQMYFIAIVLPQHLNEKILKYKQIMLGKYNCQVGLKSPAHITLVPPFWMEEEKEEKLIGHIICMSTEVFAFTISTNNFSAFTPKTIFVEVAVNTQLNNLKKSIDDFFKHHLFYNIKEEARPFHPHITIVTRDLYKKDFFEIWPWFTEKKFMEEWEADGLSILRHNKKNWDVVFTSQFKK